MRELESEDCGNSTEADSRLKKSCSEGKPRAACYILTLKSVSHPQNLLEERGETGGITQKITINLKKNKAKLINHTKYTDRSYK